MITPQDAETNSSQNGTSQNLSPARGRPQVGASQSGARGRSLRSACNFCHEKRVKCVTTEGKPRCEQCRQRDTTCIFSIKGKTGPKPKGYKSKPDTSRHKRRKTTRWSRRESIDSSAAADASAHSELENPPEHDDNVVAAPVAAQTEIGRRERCFLGIYIRSIGNFLPLVEPEVLVEGLRERQRLPQLMATTVGANPLSYVQAQVAGAISLGALISGDLPTARAYHNALNYHNNAHISALIDPITAPSLGLGTLYWQYLGEYQLKDYWLRETRRVLCKAKNVPVDLVLCIEYLDDYSRETYERPGIEAMAPGRRTLHTISCLLANMYHVLNPVCGRPTAVVFCDHLSECIRDLQHEAAAELALLLCTSLQALLLVMLGDRQAAIDMLSAIPQLLAPQGDGTPSVARSLPLCWDAVVVAAALSFLLGQGHIFRQLRSAVDSANDISPGARWAFCLPDPDSDPRSFIGHDCLSTSNICTIVSDIARRTGFGTIPFYFDDQPFTRPFSTLGMLPIQQQGASYLPGFHSNVFGQHCVTLGSVPPNHWDLIEGKGQRLSGGLHSMSPSRLSLPLSPGGLHGDIGRGRGVLQGMEFSVGAGDPGFLDDGKRYPTRCLSPFKTSSLSLCHTVSALRDRDWREGEGRGCEGGSDELDIVKGNGQGISRGLHSMSPTRLSVPLSPGGGVAVGGMDRESRLGCISSEGAMSSIGSSLGGLHGGVGRDMGNLQGEEFRDDPGNPGFMDGGKRHPTQCLSSFKTSSSSLCHTTSTLHNRDRGEGAEEGCGGGGDGEGDGTAAPCDDLGRDLVVATDGFVDDEDTFHNIMSVEAILENIDVESAINGGIEEEVDMSVRGHSDTAKGFRQVVGEIGTRLLEESQDVGRTQMTSKRDNRSSDTRSSPSHAAIGGAAVNDGPEM